MKAAILYGNEDLRFSDYETPGTGPGMVKIRVRATGICGSDIPRVFCNGAHFYPIVLGHEFAGDIVELGKGVTGLTCGDTVTGAPLIPCLTCSDCMCGNYALCKHYTFIGSRIQGSMAEYLTLPARNVIKFSPSLDYQQGALFEPATVALHGLFNSDFQGGGKVLILGGGTIGIFALQWARLLGAQETTVVDIDESRLELAGMLGADYVVNAQDNWPALLAEKSRGKGFDYIFETAGSTDTIKMAFVAAGNGARVCFIGTPTKDLTFSQGEWEQLNRKELQLVGSWMSYSCPFPGREWTMTSAYASAGKLSLDKRLIFANYPLSQANEAFSLFREPGQVHGKIMLTNDGL